jgi:hypothetical protein
MATIGYLRLLFGADTKELEAGSKRARDEMKKNKEETEKTVKQLTTFGVVAAGGAVAGLVALTKSSFDGINATRGLAERIGTSSEALSKLQYAAKLSDVDSETLSGSLEKMQIRLGQVAETGEGKAAKALKSFGLSADELITKDPVETFHKLVGVLEGIQNPAERAAVAVDLFGKSGAGMLNIVVQGSEALATMEQEADLLGKTVNDLDAAKVDEADDALTRVWDSIGGIGNALAIEVAPWITEISNRFIDYAKDGVNANSLVTQSLDWVTTAIGYAADAMQFLEAGWHAAEAGIVKGLALSLQGMEGLKSLLNTLTVGIIDFGIAGIDSMVGLGKTIANALGFGDASPFEGLTAGLKQNLEGLAASFEVQAGDSLFGEGLIASLNEKASEEFTKAGELWGKEWAHQTTRAFADEVKLGAETRAGIAVNQAEKFRGLGSGAEIDREKKDKDKGEGKHAGAFDLGSKEAYSAILSARGAIRGDKTGERTAKATERTAQASEKMADYLQGLQMMFGVSQDEAIDFLQGV